MEFNPNNTQHQHIMFLRPIEFLIIYKIIRRGMSYLALLDKQPNKKNKYNTAIFIDDQKIIYGNQEIFLKFDKNKDLIIGLESKIITSNDHDRFYGLTEYIGNFQQINLL